MDTPRALGRSSRFAWLLCYLLAYIVASGLLMIVNVGVLGFGDPKFGTWGWLIYWPLWGVMYLPPVFVASFVAEIWWRSTQLRLLQFFGITLVGYLGAMGISFMLDVQLLALSIQLVVLCVITVFVARRWFRT